MRKILVGMMAAAASMLAVFAAPALADNGAQTTMLLTPSGQPVGGIWQRWMNDSLMPTYNGPMVLDLNGGCNAVGCTNATSFTPVVSTEVTMPETTIDETAAFSPNSFENEARSALLYEQGHVIDYRYLTDTERLAFLSLWRVQIPAGTTVDAFWWEGEATGGADTMAEWFAQDYVICATHPHLTVNQWGELATPNDDGWLRNTPNEWEPSYPLFHDVPKAVAEKVGNGWLLNYNHFRARPGQMWRLRMQQHSCGLIRLWIEAGEAVA